MALYTNLAAAAIARERLLGEVTRRNRILEAMRGMLETLTGPLGRARGMAPALGVLCEGLAADAVALLGAPEDGEPPDRAGRHRPRRPASPGRGHARSWSRRPPSLLDGPAGLDRARLIGDRVVAAPVVAPQGRLVLAAWWRSPTGIGNDTLDLLDDAARSLCLAVEREEVEVGPGRGGDPAPLAAPPARVPLPPLATSCAPRSPPSTATPPPCASPT